nr:uncharacterized protein LOC115270393 [Aedes albopictus]
MEAIPFEKQTSPVSQPADEIENVYCQPDGLLAEGYIVKIQQPDADRIIKAVSDKIETVAEKVVENVTATVLNTVGAMLAKTTATLEMRIDAAIRQRSADQYSEASSSFQFTPVSTTDEIDALEEKLKNEVYAKQLFVHMKRIIGHTGDACNGLNVAYGLIDHFFDRKLMLVCSWTGESRGEIRKFAMKKCDNILDLFLKLVRSVNNTFSRTLMEDFFKRITRNSKKRSESKGQRQSSIHRRARTKNGDKSNSDVRCEASNTPQVPLLLQVTLDMPEQTEPLNVAGGVDESATNSEREDEDDDDAEDEADISQDDSEEEL